MRSHEEFCRAEEIFRVACDLEGEARVACLDAECGADAELRHRVEALLAADACADQPIAFALRDQFAAACDDPLSTAARPETPTPLPATIGHYRIARRLGAGGMGVVFEAQQEHPRRSVAVKVLRSAFASREMMQRFEREVQFLGQFEHAGIARIYEAGHATVAGRQEPYFAMELVRGGTVQQYAILHQLDAEARIRLVACACDAVHHAHQRGVLHRDLKPGNILIDNTGESPTPKVLDFGVARALTADGSSLQTLTGQVVGTLAYMSPEQLAGRPADVDVRTDVYALGVILFELLAEQLPIDLRDKSDFEAMRAIERDEPVRLGKLRPEFAGPVEAIVHKAIDKDKTRRYESAADFAADLRHHLADEPISAHATTRIELFRRFVRRNRTLVGGAIATVTALTLGLIGTIWFAVDARANAAAAIASARDAQRQLYTAKIHLAQAALADDDIHAARRHLDDAPADNIGWEWWHLREQLANNAAELPAAPAITVGELAVDPADGTVVAALADGRLARWDPVRLALLEVVDLGATAVTVAAGPPGGFAVGTQAGAVLLWYPEQQEHREVVPPCGRRVFRLRQSHDAATLLACRKQPDGIHQEAVILDTVTGARVATANHAWGQGVDLSRDGTAFAFIGVGEDWGWILSHDLTASAARRVLLPREGATSVAVAPDARTIAVGTGFRNVYLAALTGASEPRVLYGHGARITALGFSIDGTCLTTAADDETIRLWNADSGDQIRALRCGSPGPTSLAFTPDGRRLLSLTADARAPRVWSLDSTASDVLAMPDFAYHLACSPDGKRLGVALSNDSFRVWSLDADNRRELFRGDGGTMGFAISRDGSKLSARTSSVRGKVRHLYDLESGEQLTSGYALEDEADYLGGRSGLRLFKHNRFLQSGHRNVRVNVHFPDDPAPLLLVDAITDAIVATLCEGVHGTAPSPGDDCIAAACTDATVRLFDTRTRAETRVLTGHIGRVYCVEYSPDGTRLATGGNDGTIRIWDARTFETLLVLRGHTSYVFDVLFSADGETLFSASGDRTVRIWHARRD